jgi:hypothetical protein
MRIAGADLGNDLFEFVSEYYHNPNLRLAVLEQLQREVGKTRPDSSARARRRIRVQVKAGLGHISLPESISLFNVVRRSLPAHKFVSFANRFGFAVYPIANDFSWQGARFMELANVDKASIGAMMFYGFNLALEETFYLLTIPIRILAYTFYLYGKHGLPKGVCHKPWHDRIQKEVRWLIATNDRPEHVYQHTRRMLMAHEIGHTYAFCDVSPIPDIVHKVGGNVHELYRANFPDQRDLLAWNRLQDGTGSLRDLSFLLGDLFANITVLRGGIDDNTLSVMRAFHWWLVHPPCTGERPRGNVTFLQASIGQTQTLEVLRLLEEVVAALNVDPRRAAKQMIRMDDLNWSKLKSQVTSSKSDLI